MDDFLLYAGKIFLLAEQVTSLHVLLVTSIFTVALYLLYIIVFNWRFFLLLALLSSYFLVLALPMTESRKSYGT